MEDAEDSAVGYLKLYGDAVPSGVISASAAGNVLLGLDDCIKYFCRKQAPGLAAIDYEIPVKTDEGSWIVWIQEHALLVATTVGAIGMGAYVKKAAEKMAENDFKEIGLSDVVRKSVDALKKLVDVLKHTKGDRDWASHLHWGAGAGVVGIENDIGEIIYIPIEYLKWYMEIPPTMLKRISGTVREGRSLAIGVKSGDGTHFEATTITEAEKSFFGHPPAANDDGELLFPEMEHGDLVRLEGKLTRGNENANSLGLEYHGHVLNCVPGIGNIKKYKPALFLHCVVEGTVSRLYKQSNVAERRPTIIISDITPLESDDDQLSLL
ncbi:hypothetical protein [uncultured Stenotrophomonas sp.]|uniref:hypothetical protein n=1 Tax=uncultured Stenotrophomonas sp. TaxID=165438 RepID=UPI0013113D61|nr:hypothetical protein [uncultured Stenotrophomonas sp.]